MEDEEKYVVPGDKLAVIEEFIPDSGTWDVDGIIYSSTTGSVVINDKKHRISVTPAVKKIIIPKRGDIVIAHILEVRKQMANVQIYVINKRELGTTISGGLHVSSCSDQYVKSMFEVTRPGDWIQASISRVDPLQLEMRRNPALGVILASCVNCGGFLKVVRKNLMRCTECDKLQPRLTSKYYNRTFNFKTT
ncbi:MAG: exosome complex RNA-binding protein Csl4 [Candidatus Hodarchaeota archaeon]